ncbi:hypothetical protein NM208_g14275 [Fusarium decemcellulare]|uniref:Uncharacterized protein n=1 Tax=Fusarium decemcellulare TaxID=57161 RepID=A0ACC1RI42_9HYPO|nr:hypothetical protein NM208_g14275 [Fusarium decemcellulare]
MGTPRDYYADLDLPPSADAAEIRKQYRKLALKYHPDRNPGREQEVNTQFQIIQSAHEVLSDPNQKAKYDASRARNKYPAASGVKGNPWSNVSAQYPPPPRRNNAGPRATPSGAQRWQDRFSSGVPPTAKQYTASDPEAKKNAFRAFENMRKGSTAKANDQSRPPPPPPPPRTESARQRAEASFGARKTGFHPRTAMGDEPPVASSNYNSRPASERYAQAFPQEASQDAPPTPSRPPPTAMPDPLSQFRDRDSWADPRQSSPYTSHGGEKTNPFDGIPLNRAKSTREVPRRDEASSDNDAFNRQRSASAPKGSEDIPSSANGPGNDQEQPSIPRDPADRPKAPLKKTRSGFKNATQAPEQQAPNASMNGTPSVSPVDDDAFARASPDPSRFATSSTDDINTSFAEDEDATGWQFNAGSEQGSPTKPRPQSGARAGRRSPKKRPPINRTDTSSVFPESEKAESGKPESAFDPEVEIGITDTIYPGKFEEAQSFKETKSCDTCG